MNPEKRFGQIEELLAEVLMKVDRVADNQGKTLDLAVNTATEVAQLKPIVDATIEKVNQVDEATKVLYTMGESTARAVASLTVETQRNRTEINTELIGINNRLLGIEQTQELIVQMLREKLG